MNKLMFNVTAKTNGAEPSCVITTATPDRDGDIVEPNGIDFTNFQRNPVVLFGHDYSSIPVGRCTGIDRVANGFRARWKWLDGDDYAARVRNAWDQNVLNATSIGFRVLAAEPLATGGHRFTKTELLEYSVVPVPAQQDAVRTLKSLGLWRDADDIVLTLRDEPAQKSGRVLSSANLARIKRIRDLADNDEAGCHDRIADLADELIVQMEGDDESDGDESRGVVLRLVDDDPRAPLTRSDVLGFGEPFSDPASQRELATSIVRSMAEGLSDALQSMPDLVNAELRRQRGLID